MAGTFYYTIFALAYLIPIGTFAVPLLVPQWHCPAYYLLGDLVGGRVYTNKYLLELPYVEKAHVIHQYGGKNPFPTGLDSGDCKQGDMITCFLAGMPNDVVCFRLGIAEHPDYGTEARLLDKVCFVRRETGPPGKLVVNMCNKIKKPLRIPSNKKPAVDAQVPV